MQPPEGLDPYAADQWRRGYAAGYEQACRDTRTEQLELPVSYSQKATEGRLMLGQEPF